MHLSPNRTLRRLRGRCRRSPCLAGVLAAIVFGRCQVSLAQMVIEMEDGPEFEIDDAGPMGLSDIASVFPFAGPFAPSDDGAPGDRFLGDMLSGVDRGFANQLLPVLQSRVAQGSDHPCDKDVKKLCPHADAPLHCLGLHSDEITQACKGQVKNTVPYICSQQIQRFCSDDLDRGIIPCLEDNGKSLGQDCQDAIVAARHALSSLKASQTKASNTLQGKPAPKAAVAPPGALPCPKGWDGPKAGGCCTKRWSLACNKECSLTNCLTSSPQGSWEFKWLDFRSHPFTCCPMQKPKEDRGSKYTGGQALCPTGWFVEPGGPCCRRAWVWDCDKDCAKDQCSRMKLPDFIWTPVDETKENYRCCPAEAGVAGLSNGLSPTLNPVDVAAWRAKNGKGPVAGTGSVASAAALDAQKANARLKGRGSSDDELPDAPGMGWFGQPIDLASGGWQTNGCVAVVICLVICCIRKCNRESYVKEL